MDLEEFRSYCLAKKSVTEEFPFGPENIVFKVGGKIFAITNIDTFDTINLKCQPDKAIELREQYDYVKPGYHMNKQHWNTIEVNWQVNFRLLREWIDDSYNLVVEQLPKKEKELLKRLHE